MSEDFDSVVRRSYSEVLFSLSDKDLDGEQKRKLCLDATRKIVKNVTGKELTTDQVDEIVHGG